MAGSKKEFTEGVIAMAKLLADEAREHEFETLAYILECAADEAYLCQRGQSRGQGKSAARDRDFSGSRPVLRGP